MKTKLLQITRIVIAAVFFAIGAIALIDSTWVFANGSTVGWSFLLFSVLFSLIFCGVFFASGYLLFRRRYRYFASIWVVLAAFGVFGFVMGIPDRAQEVLHLGNTDWRLGLLHIASLFVGFYAARWFVRSAFRLLDRLLPREPRNSTPMT